MKMRFQQTGFSVLLSYTLAVLLTACGGQQSENSKTAGMQSPPLAGSTVWTLPNTRANYKIVKLDKDAGYQAFDLSTGQSISIPASITSIAFTDIRQNLSIANSAKLLSDTELKQLIQLYVAYFNRLPDADGLEYWMQRKAQGMSMPDIAESFFDSAVKFSELTGYQADMSYPALVKIIYKNVLGRFGSNAPPETDVNYWAGELTAGRLSKGGLILAMLNAANQYANDANWGWVTTLLNNKTLVAQRFALERGINFNSDQDSIVQTMAIAAKVQPDNLDQMLALITYEPVQTISSDNRAVSVAKMWNQLNLDFIRGDLVRPPVQARNLFHISAAMFDAWAAYDQLASTYLLGKTVQGFNCPMNLAMQTMSLQESREQTISYAAYRLLKHRYKQSPKYAATMLKADALMRELGYDLNFESSDVNATSAASLGNYIASCYIRYGLEDGSNETGSHANLVYKPLNPSLAPTFPGNPTLQDFNRWQPIALASFMDQGGHIIRNGAANFIAAEWGRVKPFAMNASQKTVYQRSNFDWPVYFDPGQPAMMRNGGEVESAEYVWSFALVAKWSSHLDPRDGVMIDISPAAMGNNSSLPENFANQHEFYDALRGGDHSKGYAVNPLTNKPYTPQIVPRGDYSRVIAEFWADGPNSETPPGHWFSILNSVSTHPQFQRRMRGKGAEMGTLEWDVKAYFTLGGAMHDAAIAAWGIKGWYDGIRPVSAIRAMADRGQSTSPAFAHYHPQGLKLEPGYIELVGAGDPLAGMYNQNLGKIKVKSWKGPEYIQNPAFEFAGVDWILAENWWPYQRSSFVTPPFAGYVSGHSTFSRAAAEVLTEITGSPYFPGGLYSFPVKKNAFLVFEQGPSVDLTLQWASYRDASDQSSLSRIWGGIHPPMDDIAGRLIGAKIGVQAVSFAEKYFVGGEK